MCVRVQVLVGEGCHPEKVKVYGPGVEKTGLKSAEPTYFTVDCTEAGQGMFQFTFLIFTRSKKKFVRVWRVCNG